MKELKWNLILAAVLYMALGFVLLVMPATTARTICYLISGVAILTGLLNLVMYFARDVSRGYYRNDFVSGVILILLGIFVIYRVDLVIALVPFIIGLCIIISGFFKCQGALDIQRMGGSAVGIFVLAAVNVVAGVLLVINPFESAVLLFRLLGLGLLFSGVTDLFSTLYLSRKIRRYLKDQAQVQEAIRVREIVEDK